MLPYLRHAVAHRDAAALVRAERETLAALERLERGLAAIEALLEGAGPAASD